MRCLVFVAAFSVSCKLYLNGVAIATILKRVVVTGTHSQQKTLHTITCIENLYIVDM